MASREMEHEDTSDLRNVYIGSPMVITFRNGTTGNWINSDEFTVPSVSGYTFCGFSYIYIGTLVRGFTPIGNGSAVKYLSAYCVGNISATSVTAYPIYRKN